MLLFLLDIKLNVLGYASLNHAMQPIILIVDHTKKSGLFIMSKPLKHIKSWFAIIKHVSMGLLWYQYGDGKDQVVSTGNC